MATSMGRMVDLVALYCRGVDSEISNNHELIRKLINMKMQEFAEKTGVLESNATISSVADQQEYELPRDVIHVKHVFYDDYEADKITFIQSKELEGTA